MNFSKSFIPLISILLIILLASCGESDSVTDQQISPENREVASSNQSFKLTDKLNRDVQISAKPVRVVSLSLTAT